MIIRRSIALVGILLCGVSLGSAQDINRPGYEDCDCVTPISRARPYPVVGEIAESSGSVLYSGVSGFIPGDPGTSVAESSHVSIGLASSARLVVGTRCDVTVSRQAEVDIFQPEGDPRGRNADVCVRISDKGAVPPPISAAEVIVPLAIVGGVVCAAECPSDPVSR